MQFTKRDVNKQYRNNMQSASGGTSGGGGVNVTVSSSGIGVDADWVLKQIKQNKVYIITTGDATGQTDSNVYSALRVDQEIQENNDRIKDELGQHFIRKDQDDSTNYALTVGGKLTGKEGVQFGETFVPGIAGGQGGKIDGQGNGELDSLIVRKFLEVPELRFNRVMVELGDKWNAPGAGIIEEVTPTSATTGTCKLKLEDGEYGAVAYGDICMGIFHSEETPSMNATADYDNGQGSFMFAGFYTCYFTITGVYSEQGKTNNGYFTYSLRPTSALWNLQYHPSVGMHFVAYGSFDDNQPTRQVSMYTTKTYTRLLKGQKTWEFTAANIAMQYGDMTNMSIFGLDMTGYSMYLTNIYHKGIIRQVRDDGSVVITANDRGAFVSGTNYAYYDRVSYDGKLWLCIAENGTNTTPSESDPTWLLQVDSGSSITSAQHWQSPTATGTKNLPYAANTIVTFADRVWISNKSTSASPYPLYLDRSGNFLTYNDGGYMIVSETQSADWDLLLDISGITDGEDGASLEVQYSTNGSSWHTTFATGDIYMRQRVGDGTWSGAMRIVGENGANGAYTNYQFAVNQSLTVAPTSGWQDAPPQVNVGYYLWMRVQKVAADGTASAWTAVRIGGEKGSKGDQGDSNVIADFTNEMDSVACTFTGAAVAATTVTTKVSLYYGTEAMTISSLTATAMGSVTASTNTSTGVVTYTIAKNAQLSTVQRSTITVSGTYSGQTYTRTLIFTLNGVRPGADGEAAVLYQIDTSAAVVAAYKDGTRSASTITVSKIKIVGSGREVTSEGSLTYSIDGGAETAYSTPVDVTAMQRSIVFFLRVGGVLYDQETIYLISDGSDGEGFTMAGAWKTSGCPYSKNNMVTMAGSTFIAKGTTSDPPYYVYTDRSGNRLTYNDGGYILTGDVNTSDWELLIQAPKDGADGTDTEWIYIHATEQPPTPATSQEDDYVPSGWHDDPIGVSESMPMEWASVRMKKDGSWGSFSTPALWAKWGADGQSIVISSQSVTYQVGTSGTTAPTGTWQSTVPSVPQGRYLWTKTIVNYSDGKSTTSYSVSRAAADGVSVTITSTSVKYAKTTTSTQPADSAFTYTSIPVLADGEYLWSMTSVNYSDNTTVKSYSVSKIGADGTDGMPGSPGSDGRTSYVHIAYATSSDGRENFSTVKRAGVIYTYIGFLTNYTQADSTVYSDYTWSEFKGADGTSVSIVSQSVTYQVGSSGTVAPSGSWSSSIPTVPQGKYLWTKTVVSYDDGTTTTAYSVSRAASDGTSIAITSTSVTYAVTTTTSQPADSAFTYTNFPTVAIGKYYWVKTIVNYSDGTSTKSYSVGRVGADGADGAPGAPGADGRTSYIHIAYATSADGSQGFSTTYFNGALYIGTYTDFTQADSTSYTSYEWARLRGEDGDGFSLAGNWVSTGVPYAKGSVVAMGGSLWAAKADTSNPPMWIFTDYAGNRLTFSDGGYILTGDENSTDWMKWASDGENGKDGADGADGRDGADAIVADLDNEMDGVAVDDRGLTQSSYALTTNVWIVKGGAKITPTSVTFSGVPSGVTCTNSNGQVTIAMPESTPIGDRKTVTITVAATIDGASYSRDLVFTIKGITGGVLYQLVPVYSTIKKNAAGALSPSTYLYVGVRKICNGVASDAGSGEVSVKYKINSAGSANAATYSGDKWAIPVAGVTSEIWIACYRTSDGQVFDEETVPVVTDGAKGSDGQTGRGITGVVRQFRLSTSPTSLIGSYSWSTTVPTRTTGTYIWARDVTYYDSGDPTYGTAFCTSGDTGFNGCTIRTHQNGFEIGKTYVNQTNVASVDMRYRDVVITPTTHSAASGYDVYMCKATSTTYAAGDEKNTSKWEEVSQNEASAYFTYLIAKEANINVLSGASFTIQDSNGETSIIIDSGGITQVYTSADGVDASVVGQPKMVFGGGMITYYNTNGSKAWQIGSAAQFMTSTIDSWVQKKLLFLSTNRNTAIVNIKTMTGTKVDAMQFSPGSSSAYISYRGYTVPSGNMSQVPSSATAISDGYYTAYATAPAQAVTEGDKVRYAVKMMRYTGGYIVSTETIEWEESL